MGTSQSSPGSPPGTPLVPPWVPPPDTDNDEVEPGVPDNGPEKDNGAAPAQVTTAPVAPAGRFAGARRSLASFALSGSTNDLRRGLGHYVRTGLGGSRTAVARMGRTARTASILYETLSSVESAAASLGGLLDPVILAGKSAVQVIGAVVEAVHPTDGTLDGEASRRALHQALSDVLDRYPEASLLELSEAQREYAVESFVALDVFNRFQLDVGKTIRDRAPSDGTALERLREAKEYIRETICATFSDLKASGQKLGAGRIGKIVRSALEKAFRVFEVYIK